MTLTYKLDLDIRQTYPHSKNELLTSRLSQVRELQTNTQTEETGNITTTRIRGW